MEALKMETQMNNWNDDRLDELNRRVDSGFKSVDQHFVRLEGEMKEGFARVDKEMKEGFVKADSEMKEGFAELREELRHVGARLDRLGDRFDRLGDRFDRLLHTLAFSAVGFAGAMLAAFAGQLFF